MDVHSARFWSRLSSVATDKTGDGWRIPQLQWRRELLLAWTSDNEYDGEGTSTLETVLDAISQLQATIKFISKAHALRMAAVARTFESSAPNALPPSVWIDINKAFEMSGWTPTRPWFDGKRVRGFERGDGKNPLVPMAPSTFSRHRGPKSGPVVQGRSAVNG